MRDVIIVGILIAVWIYYGFIYAVYLYFLITIMIVVERIEYKVTGMYEDHGDVLE